MNPYIAALGAWAGGVFDGKTVVALVLIVCSTWLAHDRILDSAAWIALITNVGGLWGLAAAAGTPGVRDVIAKMARGPE